MHHLRAAGYPVPRVYRVGRAELELEYVEGPTMLDDLLHHPWRVARHARLLAELHHRLHHIPGCAALPPGPAPGDCVVHLDLHPGNILLSPRGPMVIDWPNASVGAGASDVALTWTSLACFDHDATGVQAAIANRFRAMFLDRFLAAAGPDEARPLVPAMVDYRLTHPSRSRNVRPLGAGIAGAPRGVCAADHDLSAVAAGVAAARSTAWEDRFGFTNPKDRL